MRQADRADEIGRVPEKYRSDIGAGDLYMPFGQDEPDLVLFRKLSGQIETSANLKLAVSIIIKSEGGQSGFEPKV